MRTEVGGQCDVAVVGGGPAGCATALRLRQHDPDLAVALIEASGYTQERIGESLPPMTQPLLEGLGVWDRFCAQDHLRAFGTVSTWGSGRPAGDDFITSPFGRGWHLDRHDFDSMLAGEAASRGVQVQMRTRPIGVERRSAGFQLRLEGPAGRRSLTASFIVDATGRRAIVARRFGARRLLDDRLVGVFAFFRLAAAGCRDTRLLVEPFEDGWWYTARLSRDRAVVALMTDSDIVRGRQLWQPQEWLAALQATHHVRARLESAELEGAPRLVQASSGRLDPPSGDDWLAVGDAASTFDPLSGQGILKALRAGSCAAYAISDHLRGDAGALAKYRRFVEREYHSYLGTRGAYYATERRWPRSPFWRCRRVAADTTAAPMAGFAGPQADRA